MRKIIAIALGLALIGGSAAAAPTKHNGTWSVRLVTDTGTCESTNSYSIAVQNGNVRYLQAPGDAATLVSGTVAKDGSVDLDISRSIAQAKAVGRLNAKSGSGSWHLPMLGCSGRWTAQKRTQLVQN